MGGLGQAGVHRWLCSGEEGRHVAGEGMVVKCEDIVGTERLGKTHRGLQWGSR